MWILVWLAHIGYKTHCVTKINVYRKIQGDNIIDPPFSDQNLTSNLTILQNWGLLKLLSIPLVFPEYQTDMSTDMFQQSDCPIHYQRISQNWISTFLLVRIWILLLVISVLNCLLQYFWEKGNCIALNCNGVGSELDHTVLNNNILIVWKEYYTWIIYVWTISARDHQQVSTVHVYFKNVFTTLLYDSSGCSS